MGVRSRKREYLIGFLLIFFGILIAVLTWISGKNDNNDGLEGKEPSQSEIGIIEYDGKKYSYNYNLSNILFIGTDRNREFGTKETPGEAGQSDVLLLLSLNKETKEGVIYQIPRDTMTEVDIYDSNGNREGSDFTQIAYQYAYSIGGESGCWAVQKTVSELLYDLNIDGYIALDIAGIPQLNDAVGGVTLKMQEDYTDIDAQFAKDLLVTMNGKQAQSYLRYQDADQEFGNQKRMERQFQYVTALMESMKQMEEEEYNSIYSLMEQYIITNLSESQIDEMAGYKFTESALKFIPGTWVNGETEDEYHLDEELKKMVMTDFYVEK